MYGSYQRFMMERARERSYREGRAEVYTVRCPKCHAEARSMATSINGQLEYFRCSRATCRTNFRALIPVNLEA